MPGGGPTPLALLLSLAAQMTWGGGGREAGSGVHPLLWSHGATEYEVSPSPLASCHDIQPIWHQEGAEESGSWLAELPL